MEKMKEGMLVSKTAKKEYKRVCARRGTERIGREKGYAAADGR